MQYASEQGLLRHIAIGSKRKGGKASVIDLNQDEVQLAARAVKANPQFLTPVDGTWGDSIHTPALVIHSTDDYRTALDQGLQFYAALKMQGKPAQLAVFPESSHGLSRDGRPSQRVRRLEVILDWFGRYAPGGGR
jgi:pimeloyl-ACP methyl ester carboxylesterase